MLAVRPVGLVTLLAQVVQLRKLVTLLALQVTLLAQVVQFRGLVTLLAQVVQFAGLVTLLARLVQFPGCVTLLAQIFNKYEDKKNRDQEGVSGQSRRRRNKCMFEEGEV